MTGPSHDLELEWIDGRFAVCRLDPGAAVPAWARSDRPGSLRSVTRTDRELSIVTDAEQVPEGVPVEGPWAALRVRGTLDFSLVGILARLTAALAAAGVPTFAISTFDTDYLLVREADRGRADAALAGALRR
ncbi:MAG: ACT domain-containing protein [Planctomycetota bacterium]|jgi:hypothetical protein